MRALAGLDLNGLWDHAQVLEPDVESDERGAVRLVEKDAGIAGCVVRLVSGSDDILIGGVQAALAPHGKGTGWGQHLGATERRIPVHEILCALSGGRADERHRAALLALVDDLAGAAGAVVAIPDAPHVDEAARERLIAALRPARGTQTLLWRPIAAILGLLAEEHRLPQDVLREGTRIAIVSLMREEVLVADAVLVRHEGRAGLLWTPERSRAGLRAIGTDGGAARCAQAVASAIAEALDMKPAEVLAQTRTPWELAVGRTPAAELVRTWTRAWRRMPEGVAAPLPIVGEAAPEAPERLAGADIVLVEGPAIGNRGRREAVLAALGLNAGDRRVVALAPSAVARGCLVAARRMAEGEPAYFDFLPQIEINALVDGAPAFVPLVPRGARVAGGRLYRGRASGEFAIGAGATALSFFLLKEASRGGGIFEAPRRAEIALPEKATATHPIEVTIEQAPGQGFARVRIGSRSFEPLREAPLELDWSRMEVVEGDRESLLSSLGRQTRSSYPDVAIVEGHAIHWHPGHPKGALCDLLRSYVEAPDAEAERAALVDLRARFSTSADAFFVGQSIGLVLPRTGPTKALGTDGALPVEEPDLPLAENAGMLLDAALAKAAKALDAMVRARDPFLEEAQVGDLVGFATWCFHRCPPRVREILLGIYAGRLSVPIDSTLLVQGLGRSLATAEEAARLFETITARLAGGRALTSTVYAALARLLGGVEAAAARLPTEMAWACHASAAAEIRAENRKGSQEAFRRETYRNALRMLAGLLRVRARDPDFLVPASREGAALIALLQASAERQRKIAADWSGMSARARDRRRLLRLAELVDALIAFVHLEGTDPNIIRKIDMLSEED